VLTPSPVTQSKRVTGKAVPACRIGRKNTHRNSLACFSDVLGAPCDINSLRNRVSQVSSRMIRVDFVGCNLFFGLYVLVDVHPRNDWLCEASQLVQLACSLK
jgi:hypothetical protein